MLQGLPHGTARVWGCPQNKTFSSTAWPSRCAHAPPGLFLQSFKPPCNCFVVLLCPAKSQLQLHLVLWPCLWLRVTHQPQEFPWAGHVALLAKLSLNGQQFAAHVLHRVFQARLLLGKLGVLLLPPGTFLAVLLPFHLTETTCHRLEFALKIATLVLHVFFQFHFLFSKLGVLPLPPAALLACLFRSHLVTPMCHRLELDIQCLLFDRQDAHLLAISSGVPPLSVQLVLQFLCSDTAAFSSQLQKLELRTLKSTPRLHTEHRLAVKISSRAVQFLLQPVVLTLHLYQLRF
mmetsp:Transcript_29114/g.76887  ORF Transcript_29114/g.76887 Transcript_29114/m.76887 type:complete len:290 (-) Transcript_29114:1038-1907(-)